MAGWFPKSENNLELQNGIKKARLQRVEEKKGLFAVIRSQQHGNHDAEDCPQK
jgi:hypothetical protein